MGGPARSGPTTTDRFGPPSRPASPYAVKVTTQTNGLAAPVLSLEIPPPMSAAGVERDGSPRRRGAVHPLLFGLGCGYWALKCNVFAASHVTRASLPTTLVRGNAAGLLRLEVSLTAMSAGV